MIYPRFISYLVLLLFGLMLNPVAAKPNEITPDKLVNGLRDATIKYYAGGEDGGLAHVSYWGIRAGDPYFETLDPVEQAKVGKINANVIHSQLFQPDNEEIAGFEVTGVLKAGGRHQSITFRLPDEWNGKLAVIGTPGLRNEYASEALLAPWLLEAGYAYIAGDKGIPGGANDMLSGNHPTQFWGKMMIDMAKFAQRALRKYTGRQPTYTYAIGLSNGGYQTRRALEIDHNRVNKEKKRLFDGGLDWSGAYWPDKRVVDTNKDGHASVEEYAASNSLVGHIDRAALAMKWSYDPEGLTKPEEFLKSPPYPGAYFDFNGAGFSPESGVFWGYYNTIFDPFQYVPGFEIFRGVGYYNLVAYVYRADLRGDGAASAAAYSCYADPLNPLAEPPLYDWLRNAPDNGWDRTSVRYALRNANSAEFSVPMISVHGLADGLLGLNAQAVAYRNAVAAYGNPNLHRLYGIANAGHVDYHADGGGDFDFNGIPGDENMADKLTPMQAYIQRAFTYLVDWAENQQLPPDNTVVPTDPYTDVTDPASLNW